MMTRKLIESILSHATKKGGDAAEVLYSEGETKEVTVRNDKIEKVISKGAKELALQIFRGHSSAEGSTEEISPEKLELLVEETCERFSSEDLAHGLADRNACRGKMRDLNLYDPLVAALTVEEHCERAREMERAAYAFDPCISNTGESGSSSSYGCVWYGSTHGIIRKYRATYASLGIAVVAASGNQMQNGDWYSKGRHAANLDRPEVVGRIAALRAVRQLGARQAATQEVPVVVDREIAAELLEFISRAVSGTQVYRDTSFLANRIGKVVASPLVTIRDNPLMPRRVGSRPFDSEGVLGRPLAVVEKGVLVSYLLDSYSARKLGMRTTGHASGVSNFYLEAGDHMPEDIIASVAQGFYVTKFMGFGVNLLTGDFSKGARGLWIENGMLTYPVEGITVAGNLKDMLMQVEMVGSDLAFRGKISAPTIKISRMTIAGT